MIKFVARAGDGRRVLGLGLSRVNIERLMQNRPIHFSGNEVGLAGWDVLIFFGETEAKIAEHLQELIGPDTLVSVAGREAR
jgi:hypothetical protein